MPKFDFAVDPEIAVHLIRLSIPHARSPLSFGLSPDYRKLGIALRRMSILTRSKSMTSDN
jgi:hypothetical protein